MARSPRPRGYELSAAGHPHQPDRWHQAVFNVILGERYKMVTKEFEGLVHGDWQDSRSPHQAEFTKKIWATSGPSPAALPTPLSEMDKLRG